MPSRPSQDLIEARVDSVSDLFHPLDPGPLYRRKLSPQVADYVLQCVDECEDNSPLRLVIQMPASEAKKADGAALERAFQRYFHDLAELEREERQELFKSGRQVLAISVAVMLICLSASWLLERGGFVSGPWVLLKESLVIIGWVIVWRPAEIFLFDWMPIRKQWKLYDRLSQAEVVVSARSAGKKEARG